MKFLLDFDGVLFNTQALKEAMTQLGLHEKERSADTFVRLNALDPGFDASRFVFPDALQFIRTHAHDCDVVSSFLSIDPLKNKNEHQQRLYQEMKIRASGITDLIGEAQVHVVGESKAQALQTLHVRYAKENETCIFIDDHLQYVHEAKVLRIRAFWMVRNAALHQESMDALAGIQRIASFDDLAHYF